MFRRTNCLRVAVGAATVATPLSAAHAAEHALLHTNPVGPVLMTLVVLLLAAKLGGDIFERLRLPAVLGELLFGVALGNLDLLGYQGLSYLRDDPSLQLLSEIGVILLLFEVGLAWDVPQMLSVGPTSTVVAVLGVIAPSILGFAASFWFHPDEPMFLHVFVGATLCATSVGITARVLQDLGCMHRREARIILGAAVIDDVLGLIVLATVAGVITAAGTGGAAPSASTPLLIAAKALVFVVGSIAIGYFVSPSLFRLAARFQVRGMLLTTALLTCFVLAYLADQVGLAPIVGAFAAGLILDERHDAVFRARGVPTMHESLSPLVTFLVPLFFVRMGLLVDLHVVANVGVLGFAAALSAAAIAGKQICSLGVWERGLDRVSVGVGMVPRGEVGLIFANIGAGLKLDGEPVIGPDALAAVVIMVLVTTVVTPPLLRWSLARGRTTGRRPRPMKA